MCAAAVLLAVRQTSMMSNRTAGQQHTCTASHVLRCQMTICHCHAGTVQAHPLRQVCGGGEVSVADSQVHGAHTAGRRRGHHGRAHRPRSGAQGATALLLCDEMDATIPSDTDNICARSAPDASILQCAYTSQQAPHAATGLPAISEFPQVLLQVVDRVRSKAATYGQDFSAPQQSHEQQQNGASNGTSGQRRLKVAPETIAMLYDKWVMPMTKQVQVRHPHENDGKHGGDSGSFCQTVGMCLARFDTSGLCSHTSSTLCLLMLQVQYLLRRLDE